MPAQVVSAIGSRCLDVQGGGGLPGTPIQIYHCTSNNAAQDLKNLNGKILRIAKDGTIPAGNPFSGTGTARCDTAVKE